VVLDEYTRECLGLEVEHAMGAREVVGVLEKLVAERGAPEFIRSDNGPEFAWPERSGNGYIHRGSRRSTSSPERRG
jgi:hypothetical protein